MAIIVKHNKVSTIPDADDDALIRPSDWNDDHSLEGLGTMAEQDANAVAITGGTISGTSVAGYIPDTEKGAPLGVATLDAGGKVPVSELPAAVLGALSYQGTWDADTNTPTLTSSSGTKGYYYVVSVAGNTDLNGITDWLIGDWAVFNGSIWQKVDNTETVTSVNGQTGAVVLTTTNVAEGTNQYFTTARARSSVSAGTGISYDSGTGVITNSSPSLGGDVVGPASATDNAIARFDTTTGKLIQNSLVIIGDTGNVTGVNSLTAESLTVNNNATLGFSNTDTLDVRSRIISDLEPNTNNAKDIGTNGRNWRDGFFGRTLSTVNLEVTGTTSFDGLQGTSGQVLTSAGTGATPTWTTPTTGTVTSVAATAGTGISVTGSPITTSGTLNITNTAPDQTVVLTAGTGISTSGTYPNFTITNTQPSSGGTVTSITAGAYLTGGTITSSGTIAADATTTNTASKLVARDASGNFAANIITAALSGNATTATTLATGRTIAITGDLAYTSGSFNGSANVTGTGTLATVNSNVGSFTNASVTVNGKGLITAVSSGTAPVTSVSGTAPISSSGGATPAISISQAGIATNGYLSSTDWNTFNNKTSNTGTVTSVAATVPTGLAVAGTPITTSGTLALTYQAGYSIPTNASQTNWDSAYTQRLQWDGGATSLVAATGRTSLGLGSAAVLTAGAANGVATLDAGGTVPTSQLPAAVLGALKYQGTWNATTNTPTLTSGSGTQGYYYVVSVAGTTNLDGITDWQIGDWAIYSGTAWQKIDNTDAVTSVNGQTGAVSVGTVTAVTATSPVVSSGGTTPAISMPPATTSVSGYLTSTDWNTFNSKTANVGTVTSVGSGTGLTGGPITGSGTISLANTAVSAGSYTLANITVDAQGRITAASNGSAGGTGTVTSVGMTVPTGLSIAGSPITTSGTLALSLTAGYSIPTTASQTNWDSAYTQRLQWDGGSTNLVAATGRTSLGATTVGGNMFTLTNPSAITFPRFNADNTVSALDAASFRTAIGAGTSSTTGTVTSVAGAGTVNGLTLTGTVTTSGSLTLGGTLSGVSLTTAVTGTLPVANGGTGQTTYTNGQLLIGNTTGGTLAKATLTAGTGISITNGAGSITIASTNNGTVTGVTGTAPIVSSGGTAPAISITQATTSTNGYLSSTDWNTFNNKSSTTGTVTSVSGAGTVNGLTLTGTVTSSGSLTLGGTLAIAATQVTSGTLSGDRGVTAGSTSPSFVEYNGTTRTTGQWDGGAVNPNGTTRLNYSGYLYATSFNTLGTADTATAATHYYVETGSDGFVRPKTLANVKTEIVTSAAIGTAIPPSTSGNVLTSNGSAWVSSAPSGGAVAGGAIYENTQTITSSYTLTAGTNGMSAGPITINTGVTVTVPTGSTWVIV